MRTFFNYDKFPCKSVEGTAFKGKEAIIKIIENSDDETVVVECYPGVDVNALINGIGFLFDDIILSDECAYKNEELERLVYDDLTDDRVFGVMTRRRLQDVFIKDKLNAAAKRLEQKGKKLVIGVGATLVTMKGLVFYASVARWETELRYRKGQCNWNCDNSDEDCLTKFKRGYFFEWGVADRHKTEIIDIIDYFIDTNKEDPVVFSKTDYLNAIEKTVSGPFRVVPYFDPGVWGGQWMKKVCSLDENQNNYAWCFDCVPEENSLYYDFSGIKAEMPAIDAVLFAPEKLMGERVVARFGKEFPIRFDFLDTMGGGNLSLQVHPTTDYIQKQFNMKYTQDESYYILDCEDDGCVYLGLKTGTRKEEFRTALENAAHGYGLDAEKYVNRFPAKKHDHFLIPAGTVHCSGKNCMVLEISSTPYIFTFKLWDWGRLGLDGKPRPININHGINVIDERRDTEWVKNNLVGRVSIVSDEGKVKEEKTGLHELEFIETRRHVFTDEVLHKANGSVCVMNLVEGEEAVIVPLSTESEPFIVHYAETFIIPACTGDFIVKPTEKSKGQTLATIKAYVR